MTASDSDEIVFVGETRGVGVVAGDGPRGVKRGRYDGTADGESLAYRALEARDAHIGTVTETGNAQQSTLLADPPLFRLFRTEYIPTKHNDGCVTVSNLVRGPVRWAVVSNFKIDLDFISQVCVGPFPNQRLLTVFPTRLTLSFVGIRPARSC